MQEDDWLTSVFQSTQQLVGLSESTSGGSKTPCLLPSPSLLSYSWLGSVATYQEDGEDRSDAASEVAFPGFLGAEVRDGGSSPVFTCEVGSDVVDLGGYHDADGPDDPTENEFGVTVHQEGVGNADEPGPTDEVEGSSVSNGEVGEDDGDEEQTRGNRCVSRQRPTIRFECFVFRSSRLHLRIISSENTFFCATNRSVVTYEEIRYDANFLGQLPSEAGFMLSAVPSQLKFQLLIPQKAKEYLVDLRCLMNLGNYPDEVNGLIYTEVRGITSSPYKLSTEVRAESVYNLGEVSITSDAELDTPLTGILKGHIFLKNSAQPMDRKNIFKATSRERFLDGRINLKVPGNMFLEDATLSTSTKYIYSSSRDLKIDHILTVANPSLDTEINVKYSLMVDAVECSGQFSIGDPEGEYFLLEHSHVTSAMPKGLKLLLKARVLQNSVSLEAGGSTRKKASTLHFRGEGFLPVFQMEAVSAKFNAERRGDGPVQTYVLKMESKWPGGDGKEALFSFDNEAVIERDFSKFVSSLEHPWLFHPVSVDIQLTKKHETHDQYSADAELKWNPKDGGYLDAEGELTLQRKNMEFSGSLKIDSPAFQMTGWSLTFANKYHDGRRKLVASLGSETKPEVLKAGADVIRDDRASLWTGSGFLIVFGKRSEAEFKIPQTLRLNDTEAFIKGKLLLIDNFKVTYGIHQEPHKTGTSGMKNAVSYRLELADNLGAKLNLTVLKLEQKKQGDDVGYNVTLGVTENRVLEVDFKSRLDLHMVTPPKEEEGGPERIFYLVEFIPKEERKGRFRQGVDYQADGKGRFDLNVFLPSRTIALEMSLPNPKHVRAGTLPEETSVALWLDRERLPKNQYGLHWKMSPVERISESESDSETRGSRSFGPGKTAIAKQALKKPTKQDFIGTIRFPRMTKPLSMRGSSICQKHLAPSSHYSQSRCDVKVILDVFSEGVEPLKAIFSTLEMRAKSGPLVKGKTPGNSSVAITLSRKGDLEVRAYQWTAHGDRSEAQSMSFGFGNTEESMESVSVFSNLISVPRRTMFQSKSAIGSYLVDLELRPSPLGVSQLGPDAESYLLALKQTGATDVFSLVDLRKSWSMPALVLTAWDGDASNNTFDLRAGYINPRLIEFGALARHPNISRKEAVYALWSLGLTSPQEVTSQLLWKKENLLSLKRYLHGLAKVSECDLGWAHTGWQHLFATVFRTPVANSVRHELLRINSLRTLFVARVMRIHAVGSPLGFRPFQPPPFQPPPFQPPPFQPPPFQPPPFHSRIGTSLPLSKTEETFQPPPFQPPPFQPPPFQPPPFQPPPFQPPPFQPPPFQPPPFQPPPFQLYALGGFMIMTIPINSMILPSNRLPSNRLPSNRLPSNCLPSHRAFNRVLRMSLVKIVDDLVPLMNPFQQDSVSERLRVIAENRDESNQAALDVLKRWRDSWKLLINSKQGIMPDVDDLVESLLDDFDDVIRELWNEEIVRRTLGERIGESPPSLKEGAKSLSESGRQLVEGASGYLDSAWTAGSEQLEKHFVQSKKQLDQLVSDYQSTFQEVASVVQRLASTLESDVEGAELSLMDKIEVLLENIQNEIRYWTETVSEALTKSSIVQFFDLPKTSEKLGSVRDRFPLLCPCPWSGRAPSVAVLRVDSSVPGVAVAGFGAGGWGRVLPLTLGSSSVLYHRGLMSHEGVTNQAAALGSTACPTQHRAPADGRGDGLQRLSLVAAFLWGRPRCSGCGGGHPDGGVVHEVRAQVSTEVVEEAALNYWNGTLGLLANRTENYIIVDMVLGEILVKVMSLPMASSSWSPLHQLQRVITNQVAKSFGGTAWVMQPNLGITFDGEVIPLVTSGGNCKYVLSKDYRDGNFTLSLQGSELELDLKGNGKIVIDMKDLKVKACSVRLNGFYHGRVRGILGAFDHERWNDFMTPDGKVATSPSQFLESWLLGGKGKCSSPKQETAKSNPQCEDIFGKSASSLRACFKVIPVYEFMSQCNAHPENACSLAGAYALACVAEGASVSLPKQCQMCHDFPSGSEKSGETSKTLYASSKFSSKTPGLVVNYEVILLVPEKHSCFDKNLVKDMKSNLEKKEGLSAYVVSYELEPLDPTDLVPRALELFQKPHSIKTVVMLSCQRCRTGILTGSLLPSYHVASKAVLSQGITLVSIGPQKLSLHEDENQDSSKEKKNLIGVSSSRMIWNNASTYQGDNKIQNVSLDRDLCTQLAIETGGIAFSSETIKESRESFLDHFGTELKTSSNKSKESYCARCTCVKSQWQILQTFCQLCEPAQPMKIYPRFLLVDAVLLPAFETWTFLLPEGAAVKAFFADRPPRVETSFTDRPPRVETSFTDRPPRVETSFTD
ncbi:unnamed protein product [Cyprideis torosa]|uniref:Uncharacterized protein n=1 Tax=Cyprideis torosa TaxID=163714 RepID=A0A7R8ZIP7_9CRUS|nr:unnamed protein product [Cyprideis torosa]CAG0886663.1 unnamed protein product [Cyprideis torosa]